MEDFPNISPEVDKSIARPLDFFELKLQVQLTWRFADLADLDANDTSAMLPGVWDSAILPMKSDRAVAPLDRVKRLTFLNLLARNQHPHKCSASPAIFLIDIMGPIYIHFGKIVSLLTKYQR